MLNIHFLHPSPKLPQTSSKFSQRCKLSTYWVLARRSSNTASLQCATIRNWTPQSLSIITDRSVYKVIMSLGNNHRSRIRYLSKQNSRILTNFPKLKKFLKIRTKNSLNARVGDVAFQWNLMRFTVSC